MGDWFQCIAAPDVTEADAPTKGAEVTEWLIREGIVSPESNQDCVYSEEPGYPPGPNFADACGDCEDDGFRSLINNGVAVITSRHVCHSGQGGMDLRCAVCSAHFGNDDEDGWRPYTEAISDWWETGIPGMVACARCATERSIVDWQQDGPLVLAYFGLEFWNWPPLAKPFLVRIERVIGTPIRYLAGKL